MLFGRPVLGQEESVVSLFKVEADEPHAFRTRESLGRASVNTIEVLNGLQPGDRVVLSDISTWDQFDRVHRIRPLCCVEQRGRSPANGAMSMSEASALIQLHNDSKTFHDEVETHAVDSIDLSIYAGEHVVISGPSGCGESTLLSILGRRRSWPRSRRRSRRATGAPSRRPASLNPASKRACALGAAYAGRRRSRAAILSIQEGAGSCSWPRRADSHPVDGLRGATH